MRRPGRQKVRKSGSVALVIRDRRKTQIPLVVWLRHFSKDPMATDHWRLLQKSLLPHGLAQIFTEFSVATGQLTRRQ